MVSEFRIAPMDRLIMGLTTVMLMLPVMFGAGTLFVTKVLAIPLVLLTAIYLWIWLWFRPRRFIVSPELLTIVWPLRSRQIKRSEITDARLINRFDLRDKVGWSVRVGAGGVWGGFGWLWTERRGLMRMYISRVDRYIWFEKGGIPWIITPEHPENFLNALGAP